MKEKIEQLLDPFDKCKVECDGFIRIASHHLLKEGIQHRVMVGYAFVPNLEGDDDVVQPHFWIELEDEDGLTLTVDYRLRMWVGDHAPHGVFYNEDEYPSVDYRAVNELTLDTDPRLIEILAGNMDES